MSCYLTQNCKKFKMGQCDMNNGDLCPKYFKIDTLYNNALLSEKQRSPIQLMCEECDVHAYERLSQIQNNVLYHVSNGDNFFIYSNTTGNGKTEWALKIIKSFINKIWYGTDLECKVLFVSVPKYLIALKENITQKSDYVEYIKKNIFKASIVIWDDIGTKSGTPFEIENLFTLIDGRINENKMNIYTANMTPQQLSECLGARLASRIYGMSESIEIRGLDKRGTMRR